MKILVVSKEVTERELLQFHWAMGRVSKAEWLKTVNRNKSRRVAHLSIPASENDVNECLALEIGLEGRRKAVQPLTSHGLAGISGLEPRTSELI